MTKREKNMFDAMVRRIARDIRRKMVPMNSGTNYVMVPLTDVLSELRTFVSSVKKGKK